MPSIPCIPMSTRNTPGGTDLATLLVRCRTERDLRLEDVAAATRLTVMTISLVERGKTQPRRTTRLKLEEFLRKHGYFPKQEAA